MDKDTMHTSDAEAILKNRQVRPTANRIAILRELLLADRPISMATLGERLVTIDKSGLSRTLGLFAEREIVHIIEDGSGATKYEACHGRGRHTLNDMHPHFHCVACGATICLDSVSVPVVALPVGFQLHAVNYVVKGLCPKCAARASLY